MDDLLSLNVKHVFPTLAAHVQEEVSSEEKRRHARNQQRREQGESRHYFHTIRKAAELSNARLVKKKLPYRFFVYQENGDVFIDLVVLDSDGRTKSVQKKNISQDDFIRMIEDVAQFEGLFLDKTA